MKLRIKEGERFRISLIIPRSTRRISSQTGRMFPNNLPQYDVRQQEPYLGEDGREPEETVVVKVT